MIMKRNISDEPGPATLTYSPTRVIKGHSVVLTCRVQELGRPAATRYIIYAHKFNSVC